jgi:hypothetical protein
VLITCALQLHCPWTTRLIIWTIWPPYTEMRTTYNGEGVLIEVQMWILLDEAVVIRDDVVRMRGEFR